MEIGILRKLVPNFNDMEKYVIHSVILKQYVELGGLRLRKIHRAIRFNQRPWLKEYVDKLTSLRTAAVTDFMSHLQVDGQCHLRQDHGEREEAAGHPGREGQR